ncbi:MAG TPA: Rne/Rng family ribonuclease [Bacillota bacterium]|nr:Rne/Rng family ribonuclease [Bacillota bacterium]
MFKEIILNVNEGETRASVLEDNTLVELYIERSPSQRLVGNIYKGKVENVLPGMQAAFVNIGLERNAFLYVDEAVPVRNPADYTEPEGGQRPQFNLPRANISDVVKAGQNLVVQVTKEPIGTKGPRVTTHITLPGRFLVLMPGVDYVGISRRIENEEERERLRNIADKLRDRDMGVIVRTVAEGMSEEELENDLLFLTKVWKRTLSKSVGGQVPDLIHQDLDLMQRMLRDVFTDDVDRLVIDSPEACEKVLELLDFTGPKLKSKVKLIEPEQLLQQYNTEQEIEKGLKRKVWLKCGGYLVIDQTEALTAIDVNTGKYVGTNDLEDTVVKTNLDAAVEIARQIRLRNIGGIIIIDFIDMVDDEHRQEVLKALEVETQKDKTKTNILGITRLGLVEMTRKKVRQSLDSVMQRDCPYCEGKGKVLSEETVSLLVRKQLEEVARRCSGQALLVEAHPGVAALLIGNGGSGLRELEQKLGKELLIRGRQELHIEKYNLQVMSTREELEQNLPVKVGQVLDITVEEPHGSNPNDGIARYNGFVINIEGGGALIGQQVLIEVNKIQRTSARARPLGINL